MGSGSRDWRGRRCGRMGLGWRVGRGGLVGWWWRIGGGEREEGLGLDDGGGGEDGPMILQLQRPTPRTPPRPFP